MEAQTLTSREITGDLAPNFRSRGNTISAFGTGGIAATTGGFGSIATTNTNVQARQFQFAAKLLF